MDEDRILGVTGLSGENLSSGVGFVIIPPGIDKTEFIKDCFVSNTISIAGADFSQIHNVPVDKTVMQQIKFPDRVGEMGTAVVFLNLPKHNLPIVVACLKNQKDIFTTHENKIRHSKSSDSKIVDMDMDADDAKISLSVSGDELIPAIIELIIKGNNINNHFKLEVDGITFIKNKGKILVLSDTSQEYFVTDKKGIVVSKIKISSLSNDDRFIYEDEFDNIFSMGKNGITINDSNGNKININESGISVDANSNEIKLMSDKSIIQIGTDGINIDSGDSDVTINGIFEALYNKIPGLPIANVSQIGISKKLKIG
jgi:hypothetical protein